MPYYRKKTYRKKPTTTTQKKTPKWTASADLGYFGKYNVSYGKRSLASAVKAIVKADQGAKHKIITNSVTLLHEGHYTLNITGNIAKGDDNNNRDGDRIHLEAIKVRGFMQQVAAQNDNAQIRFMLVKSREEVLGGSDSFGSGLGSSSLYTAVDSINSIIDPKKVTVLYDTTFLLKKMLSGVTNITPFSMTLPIKQQHIYDTGTNFGKECNFYIVLYAFVPGLAGGVDTAATMRFNADLIFKNK